MEKGGLVPNLFGAQQKELIGIEQAVAPLPPNQSRTPEKLSRHKTAQRHEQNLNEVQGEEHDDGSFGLDPTKEQHRRKIRIPER